jgi:hypothetical protein
MCVRAGQFRSALTLDDTHGDGIRMSFRSNSALLTLTLALAACGGGQAQQQQPPPPPPPTSGGQTTPPAQPEPAATNDTTQAQAEPAQPAAASFTPSAEQIAAWRAATTVLDFNAQANFGGGALRTGFTPDPWGFPLTAGGGRNPVDVASLNIVDAASGQACGRAFITRRPDFHFTFDAGTRFPLLRFYVVTENASDATLLINQPNTQWRCNDDHGRSGWGNNLMPAIDFANPAPGRYDIWVGTFDASRNNRAQLFVTELDSNHP